MIETTIYYVLFAGIDHMTEKSPASIAHSEQQSVPNIGSAAGAMGIQPGEPLEDAEGSRLPATGQHEPAAATSAEEEEEDKPKLQKSKSLVRSDTASISI